MNKRGGKRENAGRKHKYGEETKPIAFKIPLSRIKEVRKLVYEYLEQYKS